MKLGAARADVILLYLNDGTLSEDAEVLCRSHKPVIGSAKLASALENDYKISADIAREASVRVNPFYEFSSPEAFGNTKAFLDTGNSKIGWIGQSNNSSSNDPLTYIGKDNDLFFCMFVHYKHLGVIKKWKIMTT